MNRTDLYQPPDLYQPSPSEKQALVEAAAVLKEHGIYIALPWDGDLDDLEKERYEAMALSCRAYSRAHD